MSDHKTDVVSAKAKTAAAMISLLAAMKRVNFDKQEDALAVEDAFESLAEALRLLNGGAP